MLTLLPFFVTSANWAVLMAGSKGYNNYRHQSDIFNIYQILKSRGFDKEKIITIAYNDVVNHEMNPVKGAVYNNKSHINVYPGDDAIDYQGDDANAESFFRVLLGDDKKGRALKTTENDDIFIYYNDHGAPGLLCVPTHNGPMVYADQLNKILEEMQAKKMFRRIFFVIEACYSGSVARNISVPNVFVLTAAGPAQSSYSADWDDTVSAFLSNEFTKQFVHYILENPKEMIINAVNYISQHVVRSHVTAFGDFRLTSCPLSTFLLNAKSQDIEADPDANENLEANSVSTSTAFVDFLERRANSAKGMEKTRFRDLLVKERTRRNMSSTVFNNIARKFVPNGFDTDVEDSDLSEIIQYDCYRATVEAFRLFCGEIDEHELRRLNYFIYLCQTTDKIEILKQIQEVCPEKLWEEEDLYV